MALKVLPEGFARDAERMARFEREAQVLASLNHANIAAIYGLEEFGESRAIVMELVDGAAPSGPMLIEKALPLVQPDRRSAGVRPRPRHRPPRPQAGQHSDHPGGNC